MDIIFKEKIKDNKRIIDIVSNFESIGQIKYFEIFNRFTNYKFFPSKTYIYSQDELLVIVNKLKTLNKEK